MRRLGDISGALGICYLLIRVGVALLCLLFLYILFKYY